jgi:hypothetical protein
MSKVMASYISDGEGGADPHPLPTRCDACWVLPLCSRLGEFSTPVHGELGHGVSLGLPIQCAVGIMGCGQQLAGFIHTPCCPMEHHDILRGCALLNYPILP